MKEVTGTLAALFTLALLGASIIASASPDHPTDRDVGLYILATSTVLVVSIASLISAWGAASMQRFLDRPPLSNEAFLALLPNPSRIAPASVERARILAARHFHDARFYPTDRLEEDLYLFRRSPEGLPALIGELARILEVDEGVVRDEFRARRLATFGNLIEAVAEIGRFDAKPKTEKHPLWDRDLDD